MIGLLGPSSSSSGPTARFRPFSRRLNAFMAAFLLNRDKIVTKHAKIARKATVQRKPIYHARLLPFEVWSSITSSQRQIWAWGSAPLRIAPHIPSFTPRRQSSPVRSAPSRDRGARARAAPRSLRQKVVGVESLLGLRHVLRFLVLPISPYREQALNFCWNDVLQYELEFSGRFVDRASLCTIVLYYCYFVKMAS